MDFLDYKDRLDFFDIAKGILIITVVISHSNSFLAQYMYWFHMPAFFFISGILFKKSYNIKDQAIKFFIPYFLFSLVDILLDFTSYPEDMSLSNFILYFSRHLYSGKAVGGVYWFIPVLFFSKLLFNLLKKKFKDTYIIGILVILYLAAHIYSANYIPEHIVDINRSHYKLWDLDVVLIALPYYGLGYYCKDLIKFLKSKKAFIISLISSLIFIKLNISLGLYYYLNMKFSYYKFPILDLLVPMIFTSLIISLSYLIKNHCKLLTYLGKNSLIVMYLHKPINNLISSKIQLNSLAFILIGVFIPIIINKFLIEHTVTLSCLTKGYIPKTNSSKLAVH